MMAKLFTTIQQLQRLDYDNWQPSAIGINNDNIVLKELVRLLPKKRLVATTTWQGKSAMAKLFFSASANYHLKREITSNALLEKIKVLTPAVLYYGPTAIRGVYIILFSQLNTTTDLNNIWQGQDKKRVLLLLKAIQTILVKLHQQSIIHDDLHLQNFIATDNKLYIIDNTGIKHKQSLSTKDRLKNLATLYAQLLIRHNSIITQAFNDYCQQCHWHISNPLLKTLYYWVNSYRYQRIINMQHRLWRSSTHNIYKKTITRLVVYPRNHDQAIIGQCLNRPLENYLPQASIIKAGNTATVFCINVQGIAMIIKRYNVKNLWHLLLHCWQASRAKKSWLNINALHLLGLPAPNAIAVVEKRLAWLTIKSYVITKRLDGILLDHYFVKTNNLHQNEVMVNKIITLLEQLACARISHGDMKASNFIIYHEQALLLDFDAMQCHRKQASFKRAFSKDLKRFMKNWRDKPTIHRLFAAKIKALMP